MKLVSAFVVVIAVTCLIPTTDSTYDAIALFKERLRNKFRMLFWKNPSTSLRKTSPTDHHRQGLNVEDKYDEKVVPVVKEPNSTSISLENVDWVNFGMPAMFRLNSSFMTTAATAEQDLQFN